jgi:curved DNA-binding protein CbpA
MKKRKTEDGYGHGMRDLHSHGMMVFASGAYRCVPLILLGCLVASFKMGCRAFTNIPSPSIGFHSRKSSSLLKLITESSRSSSSMPYGPPSNSTAEVSDPLPNTSSSSTTPEKPKETELHKRTLYKILGASPEDSRDELKKRYVALAKLSHPDAVLNNSSNVDSSHLDFTEIAAAWRILSNPKQRKRYDRSLQAEQFSQDVQVWAGNLSKQAAPAAKMFGNIALPFLRKTTAATLASVQAAANDLIRKEEKTESKDLTEAFKSAMEAARRAGRYVDSMELLEKSDLLESRALEESQQAVELEQKLLDITERRLTMALHTPGSGLTSVEAMIIWDDFNHTVGGRLSAWDRALLKHTIEYEIHELQQAEMTFVETQEADSEAQKQYQLSVQARLKAHQELVDAEQAEQEARRILAASEQRVLKSKLDLEDVVRGLAHAEANAKKIDYEMERRSLDLVKQSEKVRNALRAKEKEVCSIKGLPVDDFAVDQVSAERLQELKELRREERLLAQNSARFESKAARLLSRASKLKIRAEELDKLRE